MKALTSTPAIPDVLGIKRSIPNGPTVKRIRGGGNGRPSIEGRRVSKNVHGNINFSMLDEACLDVGKVDLSFSAKIRNDSGLSPQKASRDMNGVVEPVGYHELESLSSVRKRSTGFNARSSGTSFSGPEEDWKGWSSSILFSQEHGCPFVRVRERSKVADVLVMSEDLVDSECKILYIRKGYNLNRDNFVSNVLGSNNSGKSLQENNEELRKHVKDYFGNPRECNIFLESLDLAADVSRLQARTEEKSFSRKLSFCCADNTMSTSKKKVEGTQRSIIPTNSKVHSDDVNKEQLLGFSNRAILSAEKCSKRFRNYYDQEKCQTAMLI